MRITPLGSGSQGNSLLVEAGDQKLLVDAGFELDELERRLAAVGMEPAAVTGICLTHRHLDHKRGVADFCRTHGTTVLGTRRTLRSLCNRLSLQLRRIEVGRTAQIGSVEITGVELCHDAPQTVGFVFDDGAHRFGYATDLGCAAGRIRTVFAGLHGLLLEFNYDPEMLLKGTYPPHLKHRIAGDRGHLSNEQAAALLASLDRSRLRHLWLGHLSAHNNHPDLALAAARRALGADYAGGLHVAPQDHVAATVDLAAQTIISCRSKSYS